MTQISLTPPVRRNDWPWGGYGLAAALFVVASLILDWPWLSGAYDIPWDAPAHYYAQFVFLANALHAGDSPFWTPNEFLGHPQIADPQSMIFSPYLIAALLVEHPSFVVFEAVTFVMLALGGLAVLLYGRDQGWRPEAGAVAALAFSYGGSAAWRLQHTDQILSYSWFAITFWLLSRALARGCGFYGALAGLAAGCMVLGRDQVAFLSVFVLVGYVVWHLTQPHWLTIGERLARALKPLSAGLVCGLALVALPLAWTIALTAGSNRPAIDLLGAERGSMHPAALFTLVLSNLFGVDGPLRDYWGPASIIWGPTDLFLARNMLELYAGALPVVALAMVGGRLLTSASGRFFVMAGVLVLAYALGRYTPAFRALFFLPGADLFRRPADATFLINALFALMAGQAIHEFGSDRGRSTWRIWIVSAALLALVFAGAAALAIDKAAPAIAWRHFAEALVFVAVAFSIMGALLCQWRLATPIAAAFMTLDLALNNGPNESTALPPQTFDALRPDTANATIALLRERIAGDAAPDRRDRVEMAAIDFHWPNAGLIHGFDHDLGYNPVRLALFSNVTGAGDHVALPDQRMFSPLFASYRSPLLDMMGVRWIATGVPAEKIDPKFQPGDLTPIARTPDAYVYENPRAFPRVVLATLALAADFDAMIYNGLWPALDYRRQVLISKDFAGGPPEHGDAPGEASARIVSYRNTKIVVEAQAPQGGWLVLFDIWHPWWVARVDGAPTPIARADVMFRAVPLAPGIHRVTFTFEPLRGLLRQAWRRS